MKKILPFAFIALLFTLTSCIDIIEEIFLNKNGSGKYLITLDLKSMIGMKDLVLAKTAMSKKDSSKFAKSKTDTTIYFATLADSIRGKFKHPDVMDRALARIKVDEEQGAMYAQLELPFKNIEDVNTLLEDLGGVKKEGSVGGLFGFRSQYKVTKKSIERITLFESPVANSDSLAALGAMIFATARVKTIYHLPGKVKSTTISEAFIRGNDCVVELTYPEFTTKKKSMDGKVTFK